MPVEENKAVISRVFEEVWNQGDLDRIDELFTPEYVRHGVPADGLAGPEGEKQHRAAFRAAFPDLVITAEDMVAEGDRVAVRYTWTGTYQGTWPGIPGAGTRVTMTGIAIHRMVAGRITDLWVVGDELGLFRQLGALPAALA
ncbi:MAG: ester cyclase [Dehalococcoidia bacterium]